MFVQIARGNRFKKGKSSSSPSKKFEESDDKVEEGEPESMTSKDYGSPQRVTSEGESSAIDVGGMSEDTSVSVEPGHSKGPFFERISEKASKYLPKKASLGKLFGEKEPTITIYTIDKEMGGRSREEGAGPRQRGEREQRVQEHPELLDKLKKTRQVAAGEAVAAAKSVAAQASPYPPFRLHFLPPPDWNDSGSGLTTALRLLTCQCSIAAIFLLWLLLGATVIYITESPIAEHQFEEMNTSTSNLIITITTDLNLLMSADTPMEYETDWHYFLEKHFSEHEKLVIAATKAGYLPEGEIWSFSGSFLYVVTLLTFLGFGAPTPVSMDGKIFSVIFTLIGIPLHWVLVFNLGVLIGVKMHVGAKDMEVKFREVKRRIQHARKSGDENTEKEVWPEEMFTAEFYPPNWVKYFPYVSLPIYYVFGLLVFGVAREMAFPDLLIFPIDFSSFGQIALISGSIRFLYACYLECLFILISVNAFLVCSSSTNSVLTAAIRHGLVTNSVD